MFLLAVWLIFPLAGAFPATPQFTPFVPCPVQGCNVTSTVPLPNICGAFSGRSCCLPAEASSIQGFPSNDPACVAASLDFRCALLCSPLQSQFVSRDFASLSLVASVSPSLCSSLASTCGLLSCAALLPPSWQLRLSSSGLSSLAPPLLAPVSLGSASLSPPAVGLLHGGLLGAHSWQLVAGDVFGQLVPLNASSGTVVSLVQPAFFSSSVVPAGNGTFNGTYIVQTPGRFQLPVLLNNQSVANAPFELVYLAPTPCLAPDLSVVPTFLPAPLPVCAEYMNNACCDPMLVNTLDPHWAYLEQTFGSSPTCLQQLQILACGMACSPRNLDFTDRNGNCLNSSSVVPPSSNCSSVLVCTTFCDDIWNACMNVVIPGGNATVSALFASRAQFCTAQFPPLYLNEPIAPIYNTTSSDVCFFGLLREPACANTSYVTDRVPLVAGTEGFFTIVAQDCFGNPRISGGDVFLVTAPPGVLVRVVDLNNGRYTVFLTAFRACLDACVRITVQIGTTAVQNTPFGLNVVPACPHGPSTLYTPVSPSTQIPFRFEFTAYDEWLNLAYTASTSDFVATLTDVSTGLPATSAPLTVVSLACNGTFVALVDLDDDTLRNSSACLRFCLDALCRPQAGGSSAVVRTTNAFCVSLCNETSFIFFSDTGVRIDFRLIMPIPVIPPIFYGQFDCCLLVRNCELLGAGAYCVIRNRTDIQAFLPYNATVCSANTPNCLPRNSNLFLDCRRLNVTGGACSVPLVTQLLSPNPFPVVRLAAPQEFLPCAGLTVDGSATTNAGGRPGLWRWQLEGPFVAGDNHDAINGLLSLFMSDPLVLTPDQVSSLFVQGFTYRLRATFTNHLAQTGTTVISFRILVADANGSPPPPLVFVSPAAPVSPAVMQPLGFHAFALRSCPPVIEQLVVPVAWVMPLDLVQPMYQFLANRTVNQNSLELPPTSLPVIDGSSERQVWALGSKPSSARRAVTARARAPYAYVGGGSPRLFVLGDANLTLSVSPAFDWNQPSDGALSVAWSCVDQVSGGNCFSPEHTALYLPAGQRRVQLPPWLFGLGVYRVRAATSSALGGGATMVDVLLLTNGTAPDVTVDWVNARVRGGDARADVVSLVAFVERDVRFGVLETEWLVVSGNLAVPVPLPGLPEAVAIPVETTGSQAEYELRSVARDSEGVGYSSRRWITNDSPNGGYCNVQTLTAGGRGSYFLRCSNFEDDQSDPLSYTVDVLVPGYSRPLPLSFGRWFAPYLFFSLPPSALPFRVQVWIVDATDHGRQLLELPAISVPALTLAPRCPESSALAQAQSAERDLEALDTATLLQRVLSACFTLQSAPPCDLSVASLTVDTVLSLMRCAIRSEPSRVRSVLASNMLSFCFSGIPLSASQFDRELSLLERLAETASSEFEQEGMRSLPVVQAVLLALDVSLTARSPVFDSVAPSSESVLALLHRMALYLQVDLRPGESEQAARAPRLSVSAGWWLPVSDAVYGYPSVAQLTPSEQMLSLVQPTLLPFGHPRLGPFRLMASSAVAANYSLHAQSPLVVPSSWSLRYLFTNADIARSSAIFVFAVGSQPVVCAALLTGAWNTSYCQTPFVMNSTHVSCSCRFASEAYYAALPLAELADGLSFSPLLPTRDPDFGATVPLVPTLPAGLAFAALLVLALFGLWAFVARRSAASVSSTATTYVSSGVAANDVVPADNRLRVPLPSNTVVEAGVVGLLSAEVGKQQVGEVEDNIWVSDEEHFENVEDPLLSEDVVGSVEENGFHNTNAPLW